MHEKIYIWFLRNLPSIMYKKHWIDSQHSINVPRFGYPKSWIEEVEKKAEEIMKELKWD